jgi:hypothetical protein
MATTKVGIYRKYDGAIPNDKTGRPVPKSEWPRKRSFRWAVRWFGQNGNRYSKSFETREVAETFAESKQPEVRENGGDPPPRITLREYYEEHRQLMSGTLAPGTLRLHLAGIRLLAGQVGWDRCIDQISVRDVEASRAARLRAGVSVSSTNRELRTLKRVFNLAVLRGYLAPRNNPCIRTPMQKVGAKRPPYCSSKEFRRLCRISP